MHFTIYVTRNRRSPIIALMGNEWWSKPKSAWFRACMAGVRIAARGLTSQEQEWIEESPRLLAFRWQTIRGMLRDERDYIGDSWFRTLVDSLRQQRESVRSCLAEVERKKQKHALNIISK